MVKEGQGKRNELEKRRSSPICSSTLPRRRSGRGIHDCPPAASCTHRWLPDNAIADNAWKPDSVDLPPRLATADGIASSVSRLHSFEPSETADDSTACFAELSNRIAKCNRTKVYLIRFQNHKEVFESPAKQPSRINWDNEFIVL